MAKIGQEIRCIDRVSADEFRQAIFPGNEPVLLKGQVRSWPAVEAGLSSSAESVRYIRRFDRNIGP